MKRIVVLCDGTWNSPDMEDTTHVSHLHDMLQKDDPNQLVKYFSGVGVNDPVEEGGRLVGRGLNKILGGATGFGLGKKVKEAYTFIAENYEDGDEIYLFGFSRGAYTARSVAGMIRKSGIVSNTSNSSIRKAFRLYRKTGAHNAPDRIVIQEQRAKLSPHFATSAKDQSMRKGDPVPLVNIAFIGVWDTVGQRGLPTQLLGVFASLWNQFYTFHDMNLSSLVKAARHAVAIDERRVFYEPALWDNMDRLNKDVSGTPFLQKWFVGDHGIIGGSAKTDEVSCFTLQWVTEGAPRLTYASGKSPEQLRTNILADLDRLKDPRGIYKVLNDLLEWRDGVGEDTHPTVRERVEGRGDYRPGNISALINRWLA